MSNIVSIFAGHDANITFYNGETKEYHLIEIERLVKKRYFRLHVDNPNQEVKRILIACRNIASKEWGIESIDTVLISSDGWINPPSIIREVFGDVSVKTLARHHKTHAASAFYQSPFEEAMIVSFDGGGDDGHFNVYHGDSSGITLIDTVKADFGGAYLLCGSFIREVAKNSKHQLALAGKLMGLGAYGKPFEGLISSFEQFFFDKDVERLAADMMLFDDNLPPLKNTSNPWDNPLDNWVFDEQLGFNIAETAQKAFESAFLKVYNHYNNTLPLVMTGGASLNVLLNQKLKDELDVPIYVPPNPHDGGLSLGHIFLHQKPESQVNITYNGLPLMDRDKLKSYIEKYDAKKVDKATIAKLLKEGNIIGMVYGDSEVGPRALGNRSIVCDPNIKEMKDILNLKVKFREWYRPFAPFCKKEDADKYFSSKDFDNLEYMSYAPKVKEEYRELIPAVTHVDGTARLQTVTEDSHKHFYELLTEFGKISETNVLLNTSFNIRGLPILSAISDALYVLENTKMDYVVIEDYLFEAKK